MVEYKVPGRIVIAFLGEFFPEMFAELSIQRAVLVNCSLFVRLIAHSKA